MTESKGLEFIKPSFLGSRSIAVVPPSCVYEKKDIIDKSIINLEKLGFNVLKGDYLYEKYPHTKKGCIRIAGLINRFFGEKEIGALICKEGGEGSKHILSLINLKKISKSQKIFIGHSDATYMLLYLNTKARLVVFHGISLAGAFEKPSKTTKIYFRKVFTESRYPLSITLDSFRVWKRGRCRSKIIGGNLASLVGYLKIFSIDFKEKILFLEENLESIEDIVCSLNFLREKGVFKSVKGVLLGRFIGLNECDLEKLRKLLLSFVRCRRIPVMYGMKSGHGNEKIAVPFGIDVTLDCVKKKVVYEECPFYGLL